MNLVTTVLSHTYVRFVFVLNVLILSASNQNFDGLRMVVRFEVDACLPYDGIPSTSPSIGPTTRRAFSKKKPSGSSPNPPDVNIIRAGSSRVPQTHLLEIKTHQSARMNWPKAYPQLYLSQTPHIHHAFHKNGMFTSVKKFALGQSELAEVDKNAQVEFKKLRKLLGHIKSLVLKHGAMRISLVCVGKTLCLPDTTGGELLAGGCVGPFRCVEAL